MRVVFLDFSFKIQSRRAMYFTYLEALGNALLMNSKEEQI